MGEEVLPDDEIRALCLRVLQSNTDHEFEAVFGELKTAMAADILDIENLGIHLLMKAPKPASATVTPVLATETKEPED